MIDAAAMQLHEVSPCTLRRAVLKGHMHKEASNERTETYSSPVTKRSPWPQTGQDNPDHSEHDSHQ